MSPSALPPGPRLPAPVQAWLMLRHGKWFIAACQRRYGPVFTLRITSMGTLVYLTDPADIKAVFTGDPDTFHAGEANSMLSGILGETSVLVIDGDLHRRRRRLMLPSFHRDAVTRQADAMAEIAAADIAGWPVGTTFAAAPRMSQITLEVILRVVIGAGDPGRLAALRTVLPRLIDIGPWLSLAVASPHLQRHRPWQRLQRNLADADRLLYAEIAERRADPELDTRTDTLAMLVRSADDDGQAMSDRELRDQLMTLLLAGHDTTATALSWALERLTRHPMLLAEAEQAAEASAAGDPAGDEYLDAVCRETLRNRTVVFDVGRVLKRPVELAGHRLPAGVMVVPGMVRVHADGELYPDPERFDPHRMLGETPGQPALTPTTWFPFGGGNRRCLGATFAMVEMRVVLREILRRVELETTSARGERPRLKHVVFVPRRGARIRVRAHRKPVADNTVGDAAGSVPSPVPPRR